MMGRWSDLLNQIVDGTAEVPPYVRALETTSLKRWEPGRVWCEWNVDPAMFQDQNMVFGGFIAALADEVLGFTTMSILEEEEVFQTVDLHMSFLRPVTGGVLRIEGKVMRRRKSAAHVEAIFRRHDGKIAAKAAAREVIRRMGPAQRRDSGRH